MGTRTLGIVAPLVVDASGPQRFFAAQSSLLATVKGPSCALYHSCYLFVGCNLLQPVIQKVAFAFDTLHKRRTTSTTMSRSSVFQTLRDYSPQHIDRAMTVTVSGSRKRLRSSSSRSRILDSASCIQSLVGRQAVYNHLHDFQKSNTGASEGLDLSGVTLRHSETNAQTL